MSNVFASVPSWVARQTANIAIADKTSFTKIAKEVAKNLDVVSNRKFVAKVLREEKTVSELKNKLSERIKRNS